MTGKKSAVLAPVPQERSRLRWCQRPDISLFSEHHGPRGTYLQMLRLEKVLLDLARPAHAAVVAQDRLKEAVQLRDLQVARQEVERLCPRPCENALSRARSGLVLERAASARGTERTLAGSILLWWSVRTRRAGRDRTGKGLERALQGASYRAWRWVHFDSLRCCLPTR